MLQEISVFDPISRAIQYAADLLDPPDDPYFNRLDLWVQEFIAFDDEPPTEYQLEVLRMLPEKKKVSTRGPHGLGKTALASWAILAFALTRDRAGVDWKIPTTASVWRQLEKFLWPEIHKWARKIRWDKLGWRGPFNERTELQTLNLKLRFGSAFALASDTPESIEGVHADHVLYIYDEAKAIPSDVYDATEGAFSGAGESTGKAAWAMANSTPGSPSGRFYDIQTHKPGYQDWWTRHVTLAEAIAAKRISWEWVEARKSQWGEGSSVFKNRVLGEFASEDSNSVIPLSWVELANERWLQAQEHGGWGTFTCLGCDIARGGEDKTVFAHRYGWGIRNLERHTLQDTVTSARQIATILHAQDGHAVVDVIGIGAGVVDQLRDRKFHVVAFNASRKSDLVDASGEIGFTNSRSAAWWNLRELLNPANKIPMALPPDDALTGDLVSPTWKMVAGGNIQVESKDDIKKRIGRSPDDGDAVVMAFWPLDQTHEETVMYEEPVVISRY